MRIMKRMVVTLLLIIGTLSSLAATVPRRGTIRGIVLSAETRQALPGVAVECRGTPLSAVSGADGTFVIGPLPAGGCVLQFSLPDFQPYVLTDVMVKAGQVIEIEVDFPLLAVVHESMTVRPQFFAAPRDEPASSLSFANEEIRRAPGAVGDVSRIVFGLPCLAKVNDQANILAVRGGSSYENLYVLDNIVIPNINHFPSFGMTVGNLGLLYVDFIRDVAFRAGGFPVIFGGRASSVMEIAYREGGHSGLNGQLTLDMGGAGAAAEGPLPGRRGSWMFAVRRSYFDLLTKMVETGSMPRFSDIQGKVVLELGKRGKLTLLGLAGFDHSGLSREYTEDSGEAFYGPVTSHEWVGGVNWFQIWSGSLYSETSFSRSFTRHGSDLNRSGSGVPAFRNRSVEEQWRLRSVFHLTLSGGWRLYWGGEAVRDLVRLDYWLAAHTGSSGEAVDEVARRLDVGDWDTGAFAGATWRISSALAVDLGLRFDRSSGPRHGDVSPRASLTWQMGPRTSLTAGGGLYCQPWPLTLLAMSREARQALPIRAVHGTVELQRLLSEDTRLTLTAYSKYYSRLPLDPDQPELCILDDVFAQTLSFHSDLAAAGRGIARGVELTVQKKLKDKLYGMAGLSWSRSRYRGPDDPWRDRVTDNRFTFSLEGGYRLSPRWEISGRWIIAGGRPFTPIDEVASAGAGSEVLDMKRVNGARLPAYHSLNLRADRRFSFRASTLTAYLSVWNVYDNRNVVGYYWDAGRRRVRSQLQWGLLPMLGLEFEF